jgi:hypothetical protein
MSEISSHQNANSLMGTHLCRANGDSLGSESSKFQTTETCKAEARGMGAIQKPSKSSGIGAKSINTEDSINTVVPPEIGKGSLNNIIV